MTAKPSSSFDHWAGIWEHLPLARLHRSLLSKLALPPDAAILDLGAGSGRLARAIAGHWPTVSVTGVDSSEKMVRQAQARSANDPRLSFILGDAGRLPFPDRHFSLVVSTLAFHHFADHNLVLREAHRVLQPGGRLVIADIAPRTPFQQAAAWLLRRLMPDERFVPPERLSRLVRATGFRGVLQQELTRWPPFLATWGTKKG